MSTGLNKDAEGDISIMVWSGDGQYYEDIGHMDWTKDDIKAQNVAAVYAVAKKFNETYPNVKINLLLNQVILTRPEQTHGIRKLKTLK